eukprot:scaffold838_cov107-Isochrysis_galbana.AAC.1
MRWSTRWAASRGRMCKALPIKKAPRTLQHGSLLARTGPRQITGSRRIPDTHDCAPSASSHPPLHAVCTQILDGVIERSAHHAPVHMVLRSGSACGRAAPRVRPDRRATGLVQRRLYLSHDADSGRHLMLVPPTQPPLWNDGGAPRCPARRGGPPHIRGLPPALARLLRRRLDPPPGRLGLAVPTGVARAARAVLPRRAAPARLVRGPADGGALAPVLGVVAPGGYVRPRSALAGSQCTRSRRHRSRLCWDGAAGLPGARGMPRPSHGPAARPFSLAPLRNPPPTRTDPLPPWSAQNSKISLLGSLL